MHFRQWKRRDFITLLGGAAATWPIGARAQQPALPVVGFLNSGSAAEWAHLVAAFKEGLNELGYVEGRNVAVEYRWAQGENERLPGLAAGINFLNTELTAKRLELLRELIPGAVRVAVLVNPSNVAAEESTVKDVNAAGRAMGLQIQIVNAGNSRRNRCSLRNPRAQATRCALRRPRPLF
jgi:hypothetical protein